MNEKRIIKFRAWIKGEMIYDRDYEFICDDGTIYFERYIDSGDGCYSAEETVVLNNTLMQSTGIKDINNKDIFEGDIVELSTTRLDVNKTYLGEVVFTKGTIIIKCDELEDKYITFIDAEFSMELKIISNVYETDLEKAKRKVEVRNR